MNPGKNYRRYNHILVPLGGSESAEQALPDALALAQQYQTQITLLKVVVPMEHSLDADVDEPDFMAEQGEKHKELARQYLNSVCERFDCADVPIHVEAIMEDSRAEGIIDYVNENAVDLIVMATHGRSGFQRWAFGSVADTVLHGVEINVLLVRVDPEEQAVEDD